MPAVTVITFTDADGDEFPVALPGYADRETDDSLEKWGRNQIQNLIGSGDLRPTMPLTLKSIKRPE